MPAFNAASSLKKSITSFQELAKEVNDASLWIIDDCSTDGSLDLVESIAESDENINILRNEKNIGPGLSRNRALEKITDGYIGFIDSDDEILPQEYYKSFVDGVKKEADFITCNAWVFKNGEDHQRYDFHRLIDDTRQITRKCLRGELDGSVIFSLYSVDLINEHRLRFPVGFYEDIPFSYNAMMMSTKRHISDAKSYRKFNREGSIVNSISKVHIEGLLNSCISVKNATIIHHLSNYPEFQEDFIYGLYGYLAHALISILENGGSDVNQMILLEHLRDQINILCDINDISIRSHTKKDKLVSYFLDAKYAPTSLILKEISLLYKKLFKGNL